MGRIKWYAVKQFEHYVELFLNSNCSAFEFADSHFISLCAINSPLYKHKEQFIHVLRKRKERKNKKRQLLVDKDACMSLMPNISAQPIAGIEHFSCELCLCYCVTLVSTHYDFKISTCLGFGVVLIICSNLYCR